MNSGYVKKVYIFWDKKLTNCRQVSMPNKTVFIVPCDGCSFVVVFRHDCKNEHYGEPFDKFSWLICSFFERFLYNIFNIIGKELF